MDLMGIMDNELKLQSDSFEIKSPPRTILGSLRYLGPGLILSAAVVGSGELIATTILGAKAGFLLLWVILFGCLAKVAIQVEYGRFCIVHGIPTLQAWNRIGKAKIFSLHWSIYCGVLFMLSLFFGQGGVLGGSAQVAHFLCPSISIEAWIVILATALALMVFHGKYGPVEIIAALFNLIFVGTILYCVFAVQSTPYAFSMNDLLSGFTFHMPAESIGLALAAFGITGVAAGELIVYPYWCLEKGYAAWAGSNDGSPEWVARARGWMRVMAVDALASMIVYTIATCAFYILGAAVLAPQKTVADGNDLILQLSSLFTGVLGEGSRTAFMICSFTVLFSTIFSNTAGFSRVWTDFFGLCRWIDWNNRKQRLFSISAMAWIFPLGSGLVYFFMQQPLLLVKFMGICNAIFLVVAAYQAWVFRYRQTIPELKPSRFYDAALWLSLASIGFLAVRTAMSIYG